MTEHVCVDCRALPALPDGPADIETVEYRPVRPRPAPHGGPRSRRCTTHHRARKRAARAATHDAVVARTYGLARGEYAAALEYQGGACAICRRATGKARRLAVDHDHDTGDPRGLLCSPCNHDLLGRYGVEALRRAIDYLADPPIQRMRRELAEEAAS